MAHPLAQPAEDLVALDLWVRRGGRVLLLADPMLEWPSKRPLGDPLRPPTMFMDTGLLAHWGLRLNAPDGVDPGKRSSADSTFRLFRRVSCQGVAISAATGLSRIAASGKGRATVVADADLLNVADIGPGARP